MKFNDVIASESWSQKYKNSINCSHPKGFSQRAHCAGKNKQNESVEMEMVCADCGMCKSHGSLNEIKKGQKDSNGYTRCWPGKHAEGTKKGKNGGQVRNCVPNESIQESKQRCQQCGMTGCSCRPGTCKCKPVKGWIPNKGFLKAMAEAMRPIPVDDQGNRIPDRMSGNEPKRPFGQPGDAKSSSQGVVTYTPTGLVHRSNHGDVTPRPRAVPEGSQRVDSLVTDALKIMRGSEASDAVAALKTVLGDREYNSRRGYYNFYVRQLLDMLGQQGMAEGASSIEQKIIKLYKQGLSDDEIASRLKIDSDDVKSVLDDYEWVADTTGEENGVAEGKRNLKCVCKTHGTMQCPVHTPKDIEVLEDFNGEYDDEAGMAQGNLYTIAKAAQGLLDTIDDNDNLPEWAQEKIAKVEGMLVTVWNYLQSQKAQGIDPEINEMYEAMDQLAEEMAAKKGISADLVWESFEALDDNMLYETAAWRRKEGKSKKGGLNAKGVASYRRENPGSKLQTAVTTKPSKLKPGSKAAKRRKSFCARMSGVKGPAKKPNGEPTRKTLALRKWNC